MKRMTGWVRDSFTCSYHSFAGTARVSKLFQARRLTQRPRALARAQHLGEEGHGLEERPAVYRIDVFHGESVVGIAVPVLVLLEQLAQRLPAVAVHRRGRAGAALVRHEAREIAAVPVDALGVVGGHARGLLALLLPLFLVVVLEVDRVQVLEQRQVEDREVHRRRSADVAVVVPGVVRREHEVARPEDHVLALDAGEVLLSGEPEADRARRVPVRRHDLVGIVEAIRGVHRGHRRAPRREPGVHQDERAALRLDRGDELGGFREQRLDDLGVRPQERYRLRRRAHQALHFIVSGPGACGPERKHVLARDVLVQRFERCGAVGNRVGNCGGCGGAHPPQYKSTCACLRSPRWRVSGR